MVSTSSGWHVRVLSQNPVPPWTLPLGDATPSTRRAEGVLTGCFTDARRLPVVTRFHRARLGRRDLVLSLAFVQCSDAWRPSDGFVRTAA